MSNITVTSQWPASFVVIDDGDLCSNAEHLATAQKFADALTWLREGIPGKAVTLTIELTMHALANISDRWTAQGAGYWAQTNITSGGPLVFRLPLPSFGVLQSVTSVLDGSISASHGSLPASMPTLVIQKTTHTIGSGGAGAGVTTAQLGSTATDGSLTVAAYELPHELAVGSLAETINPAAIYVAQVTGESGANSVASALGLLRLKCVVTAT